MAKTAWPDTTELTDRLTGLGVTTVPTGVVLQDELDAAVERLERVSGHDPFLVQDAAAEYKYDPSLTDIVVLERNWVTITQVTLDGVTLTSGTDYWTDPYEAPYRALKFAYTVIGTNYPQIVGVTGKRGYAAQIPTEVFNAVLDYAAGKVFEKAAMAGTVAGGQVVEIQQDSVKKKFGGSGSSGMGTAESLTAAAERVFAMYKRPVVGGL